MSFLKILRYELKKIFEQKGIWIIAFIFICVSFFNIYKTYYTPPVDKESGQIAMEKAEKNLKEEYSGELSIENINRFMTDYQKAEQASIVDNPNKYNPSKYYSGFAYGDFQLYKLIKDEMERIYFYNDYVVTVRDTANEIADSLENINPYLCKYNRKISQIYSDRKVTHFYNVQSVPFYFEYKFSSLIIILLILLGLTSKFCGECELGMDQTLKTCKYGRDKTNLAKICSGWIYIIFLSVLFSLLDYIMFKYCLGFNSLDQYLYAIEEYSGTTLNLKIWQALLLVQAIKTLGFLVLGSLIMLISAVFRSSVKAYAVSVFAVVSLILATIIMPEGAGEYINLLNPVRLINSQTMFKEFQAVNIFGTPVFTAYAAVTAGIICFVAIFTATFFVSRKYRMSPARNSKRKQKGGTLPTFGS